VSNPRPGVIRSGRSSGLASGVEFGIGHLEGPSRAVCSDWGNSGHDADGAQPTRSPVARPYGEFVAGVGVGTVAGDGAGELAAAGGGGDCCGGAIFNIKLFAVAIFWSMTFRTRLL
jgi:hypothetical protein